MFATDVAARQGQASMRQGDESGNFLDVCHEKIRQFHAYWHGKCAGRPMPSRADIDPLEMKDFLPGIILVDVVPDERRFVYRLVGTREVDHRGYDPTGKSVGEGFCGISADETLGCYQYVMEHRLPLFDRGSYETPEGRWGNEEILFLPLSSDGETVDKILVFSHYFIA